MKCQKCKSNLRKVRVNVEGARSKILSYQCVNCEYFRFEEDSASKVISELKDNPLKIKQKVIKLSNNRLGMYFNKHVIESLELKAGENISIIVPDRKHILINLED